MIRRVRISAIQETFTVPDNDFGVWPRFISRRVAEISACASLFGIAVRSVSADRSEISAAGDDMAVRGIISGVLDIECGFGVNTFG